MEIERQRPEKSDISHPEILKNIFREPRIRVGDFIAGTSSHRGPNRKMPAFALVIFSWVASGIDIGICLGLSLIAIAVSAKFMHSGFREILSFFHGSLFRLTLMFFIGSVGVYKLLLRSFMGYTLGEWACGLRMGDQNTFDQRNYILKVFVRFVVVFGTGVILMPILSLVIGKDLAGQISGLKLKQL